MHLLQQCREGGGGKLLILVGRKIQITPEEEGRGGGRSECRQLSEVRSRRRVLLRLMRLMRLSVRGKVSPDVDRDEQSKQQCTDQKQRDVKSFEATQMLEQVIHNNRTS